MAKKYEIKVKIAVAYLQAKKRRGQYLLTVSELKHLLNINKNKAQAVAVVIRSLTKMGLLEKVGRRSYIIVSEK